MSTSEHGTLDNARRLGEFRRPQTGTFQYVGGDLLDSARHFGLARSDSWITSHLRDDSGRHYHILRHYGVGTSTGVTAAVSREDGIYFDPRKMDYLRGGTVRRYVNSDGDLCMTGSLGMQVGAEGVFVADGGLKSEVVAGARATSVKDSGLIDLKGPLLGPGHWFMMPWQAGTADATMHTALYYNVKGTVYGETAQGIMVFENIWSPPGLTCGDSPLSKDLMGLWCAFAQEFEDGSVQYGQLQNWTSAGSFSNITDNGKHITSEVTSSKVFYRDDGFADRIEFRLADGDTWECVTEANGVAIDTWKLAQSTGQTFRTGHKGYCGRVGDKRKRRSWYGIFEVFPDRLRGFVDN